MPHGITLDGVFIARVHRIHSTRIYNIHFMSGEKKKTLYVTIHNKNSKLFHFSKKRIVNSEVEYSK